MIPYDSGVYRLRVPSPARHSQVPHHPLPVGSGISWLHWFASLWPVE